MIGRIIERDKEARNSLTQAKLRRVESEQKISDMKTKKREEYLNRARANIKSLEKSEKIKAFVRLKAIEHSYSKKTEKMEKIYSEKNEEWTDILFNKVLER